MPWYKKCSIRYLNYIYLPMLFERKQLGSTDRSKKTVKGKLPKAGFEFILKQLRKWIVSLPNPEKQTVWSHYDTMRNYDNQEVKSKHAFLEKIVSEVKPEMLWDIGCNTGEFSLTALESGASYVVGMEMDHGALAKSFKRSQDTGSNFLPIYQNLLNPSPNLGWCERERSGLLERSQADMVISLAVLHHIVIGGNVPLEDAITYLTAMAPSGIIEWVPKNDGMVQTMLANREDIFKDYDEASFSRILQENAKIVTTEQISASGRKLFYYTQLEAA